MALNDKKGKSDVEDDDAFPEDVDAQRELARELFEAILDVSDTIDGKRKPVKRPNKNTSNSAVEKQQEFDEEDSEEEDSNHARQKDQEGTLLADHGEVSEESGYIDTIHMKRIKALSNFEAELLAWELLVSGQTAVAPNPAEHLH